MDHSPGQRQFAIEQVPRILSGQISSDDDEMDRYEEEQMALAAPGRSPTARPSPPCAATAISRWPATTTHDHVLESHQLGSVIAEFPTTFEAARPHASTA
jgi:alpha-D-ribose 1-methylphosphonate 5-triphosphate diphosphatase